MAGDDGAECVLLPGQTVTAVVTGREPWGVFVRVVGSGAYASIDAASIDSPAGSPIALPEERPEVGDEVTAVVQQVRWWGPPQTVRLSLRAAALAEFRWPCDVCGTDTTLSPGGDGVVMALRGIDVPQDDTVITHGECLRGALHPDGHTRRRVTRFGWGR